MYSIYINEGNCDSISKSSEMSLQNYNVSNKAAKYKTVHYRIIYECGVFYKNVEVKYFCSMIFTSILCLHI